MFNSTLTPMAKCSAIGSNVGFGVLMQNTFPCGLEEVGISLQLVMTAQSEPELHADPTLSDEQENCVSLEC